MRVDTGVAEGDAVPPEFDSMIAKIIAHGATREQAIARLRRAVADTMVVIDEGTTNQGFLLELLGRPELRRGEVDTGWLDRLQGADEVQPVRHADTALIQAAIALCDAATADERARFYALARRGRPHAEADICRTVDLLHRGTSYRFGVCQVGPARYLVEVDGARIEADVEWVSEHERRLSYGGRSFRTMTALQDNDLLVEVNGVPHRVSRDEGGLVRSHSPGVVVAIRVSEGDEVQAGDVVAVTESMKMESSLVAPVSGRVREVLVSANVQVPGGRPLVQIDPQDDSPAAVEGKRATFDAGDPEPGGGPSGLERLRRLALGYDVTPAEAKRVVGEVHGLAGRPRAARAACSRSTPTSAPSTGPHAERERGGEALSSPQEHLHAFLRSLDAEAEGLPDRFVAQLERALGHLGVSGLERTAALEDAAYRLFLAQQRGGTARDAVRALLARRLEQGEPLEGEAADAFRGVLDRLEAALAPREPALAELARELRWRCCDRPAVEAAREETYAEARAHLAALAEQPDAGERAAHLQALVDCPQPLARLLTQGTDDFLLEALTRRYYRIRALEGLERREVDGVPFLLTSYVHDGTRHHVAAAFAEPDRLPAALAALATHAGTLPEGEPLLGDLYATSAPADVDALVADADLPPGVARLAFVSPAEGAHAVAVTSFTRGGRRPRGGPRPARPASADGAAHGPVAARELRARAPPVGSRRLPLPRPGARQRARRAPRRGRRGPRPHAGARRRRPDRRPARARADRPPGVRGDPRRPVAARPPRPPAVEPRAALRLARGGVRARRGPRGHHAPRADVRRARDRDGPAAGRRPRPALLQPRRPRRRGRGRRPADPPAAAARRGRPPDRLGPPPRHGPPRRDHQDPRAAAPAARRGDPGRRVHRVRPRRRRSARRGRAPGRHQPREHRGRLIPLIRNRTERYPEGMQRVVLLGDPTRGLGSLAEPECSRVIAALDLAEELDVPVEWFALSSGARIAMDSGTENMDWVAAALRRIVGFTQAGGEINVVVTGINVGAQPYWNAEATMLMHTKGILVMTPESAMVLTGKQALDYSGGVSAEDNFGIGGYERVMGPNGQAQYRAPDLAGACEVLLNYYEHAYVAPGERFPRRAETTDPTDRDVGASPHEAPGSDLETVGEIFAEETNPGRKKPFDIRAVMRAVADADHPPLERWAGMREAEIAVTWDAHLGGWPVALLGIECRPLSRFGSIPADGPEQWTSGTLFPLASKKVARAINAASGRRPLVVLANLAGFDGSPESMRRLQLEYGAEIGRAIVNFEGPIAFCVISRFHGGAFVVFSRALNDNLETIAIEGAYASVLGGAPAAAVVFARDVDARTREDERIAGLDEQLATAENGDRAAAARGARRAVDGGALGEARRGGGGVRRRPQRAARRRGRLGRPRDPRVRAARRPDRHDRARDGRGGSAEPARGGTRRPSPRTPGR